MSLCFVNTTNLAISDEIMFHVVNILEFSVSLTVNETLSEETCNFYHIPTMIVSKFMDDAQNETNWKSQETQKYPEEGPWHPRTIAVGPQISTQRSLSSSWLPVRAQAVTSVRTSTRLTPSSVMDDTKQNDEPQRKGGDCKIPLFRWANVGLAAQPRFKDDTGGHRKSCKLSDSAAP